MIDVDFKLIEEISELELSHTPCCHFREIDEQIKALEEFKRKSWIVHFDLLQFFLIPACFLSPRET